MIALWHCVDARSFRPLWALEEIGLQYRLEILPFPPRYLAREYLEINPLGTIPLLVDGETRMTESAAICQYLAERYAGPPLAVRPDEQGYGAYLNALHFGEATLTFPQTIVLRYGCQLACWIENIAVCAGLDMMNENIAAHAGATDA